MVLSLLTASTLINIFEAFKNQATKSSHMYFSGIL